MKFLNACSKTIAVGFAAAFLIFGLLALILFNVQSQLLDSETYNKALEDQEIYEQLPTLVAKQIATSMTYNPCREDPEQCEGDDLPQDPDEDEGGGPPPYLKNLSQDEWEQILSQILTPEWTKSQAESVLVQIFTFLDSGEDELKITISLVELKENLTGENGADIIRILVNAQPLCTESLLGIFVDMVAGDFSPEQLLTCRPPQELLDELAPVMQAALDLVIDDLPDTATIGQDLFGGNESQSPEKSSEGSNINIQTVRLIPRLSPFLPLVFLVLLSIFGIRSLKDLLLWWGIPFAMVGLSALVLVLVGLPIFNWILTAHVEVRIPAVLDPAFVEIGLDTLRLIFGSLLRTIAVQAGLIAFLGIILTGVGIFVKASSQKDQFE